MRSPFSMLRVLQFIRDNVDDAPSWMDRRDGICPMLFDTARHLHAAGFARTDEFQEVYEVTCADMAAWPKHSGTISYPVRHPELAPELAYYYTEDKWDASTEYGRNRRELLDYLIEKEKTRA